jgi:hypothetical protein
MNSLIKYVYHDFLSRQIRLGIDPKNKLRALHDPDFGWYAWAVEDEMCGVGSEELGFYLRYGIFEQEG